MNKEANRLESFIRSRGYNLKEFALLHNLAYHALTPVTSGKKKIGMKLLRILGDNYPTLNLNWLLYDRGPMELQPENRHGMDELSFQLAKFLKEDEMMRQSVIKFLKENNEESQ